MNDLSKAKAENLHLRITASQKMRLKEISQKLDVSISSLIRYGIDLIIAKYEDIDEELGQV